MTTTWDDELTALHRAVSDADEQARDARQARDDYIRRLVADGVTAYRIAQTLDVSQTAIAKIVRAKGE